MTKEIVNSDKTSQAIGPYSQPVRALFVRLVLFSLFMLLVGIRSVSAEERATIQGLVADKNTGEGLWNVNVTIEGTTLGAASETELLVSFSMFRPSPSMR